MNEKPYKIINGDSLKVLDTFEENKKTGQLSIFDFDESGGE